MKKLIFILLPALFFVVDISYLHGQLPTQEWEKRFTNGNFASGYSVKLDSSGNVYVLAGNSQADSTNGDYCVIKYSSVGTFIWSRYYNSPGNLSDDPTAFAVTKAGEIYITGHTSINFNRYVTTVKFNSDGILQWAKIYSSPWQNDDAYDISMDKSGNAVICGATLINSSLSVGLIIKYSSDGDSLWVRKYNPSQHHNVFSQLVIDDSSNIVTAGYFDSASQTDYLIVKYAFSGNILWEKTYNSLQNYNDAAWYLNIDTNRNIYVIGTNAVPTAQANNTLVKLTNTGSVQWARVFTGILPGEGRCQYPAGVVAAPDGSAIYYTTFCSNGTGGGGYDIVTLCYNSIGDTQWVKRYWGAVNATLNQPATIILDRYSNIYLSGVANYSISGDDYVTIKYLPNGIQQWVVSYNGPLTNSFDYANGLVVDSNFVYVTGTGSRFNGNPILWDAATIKYNQPIGISNNNNSLPVHFKLHQNYPNPFNGITIINYEIPVKSNVQLKVYNSLGQLVKILVNREQPASYYTIIFNTVDLSSGVYFYSLVVNNNLTETRKFILAK